MRNNEENNSDSKDFFSLLPVELLRIIFSFLTFSSYAKFIFISKHWKNDLLPLIVTRFQLKYVLKKNEIWTRNESILDCILTLTNLSELYFHKNRYQSQRNQFYESQRFYLLSILSNIQRFKLILCKNVDFISNFSKLKKLELSYVKSV